MEVNNEFVRKHKHEKVYDCDSQICVRDVNSLATEKKNGDIDNVSQVHDLTDMDGPRNVRDNQSEKESKTYIENSVADCEQPKLIICLNEASYHVKDICIDEPSLEKIVIENGEISQNGILTFNSGSDVHTHMIKGMVDSSASISDEMKPSVEHDTKMDVTSKCPSKNLTGEGEGDLNSRDGIVYVSSRVKFLPEEKLSVRELETGNSQLEAFSFDSDEGPKQTDQDTNKEAESSNSKVHCTADEPNCNNANSSSLPAKSVISEDPQTSDGQQSVQTVKTPSLEDGSSESRSASSRSLFTQHGQGESSFSAVDTTSALVTYSGAIPHSGNISLRSDSSTTSNRSFAFPVLQSDWNSSPVKMAKADGRHYRKHQRWKMSLLCCRF